MNINTIVNSIPYERGNCLTLVLFFNNTDTACFMIDIEEKEIVLALQTKARKLLDIENTYEDYVKLIKDLGYLDLEQLEKFKKHWTPCYREDFYFINIFDKIFSDIYVNSCCDIDLLNSYKVFPTEELAKKSVNLSKLGRLILLWQYSNDCLFEPDWKNLDQPKHSIIYVELYKDFRIDMSYTVRGDKVYFKTEEQAQTFIEMYETEIKKLWE